jgi:predicted alpha/beta-hydrolase family hydrolase
VTPPEDVESYELSDKIDILWLEDRDRLEASKDNIRSFGDHMITMSESVVEWSKRLV